MLTWLKSEIQRTTECRCYWENEQQVSLAVSEKDMMLVHRFCGPNSETKAGGMKIYVSGPRDGDPSG